MVRHWHLQVAMEILHFGIFTQVMFWIGFQLERVFKFILSNLVRIIVGWLGLRRIYIGRMRTKFKFMILKIKDQNYRLWELLLMSPSAQIAPQLPLQISVMVMFDCLI